MGALWIVLAVLMVACAIHYYLKATHRPTTAERPPAAMERTHEMEVEAPMLGELCIRSERECVGRGDALDYLKKHVIEAPRNCVAVVSAHGAGGIGKTFLAHVFSEQNRKHHNFIEIYLGPGRSAFDAGVELLDRLNIPAEQTDSHHKLVQALEQVLFRTKGVLILDDVHDESAKILFPKISKWRVLITTRDQELAERLADKVFILDLFTVEESMELYQMVLGDSFQSKWSEGCASLAEYLGRHPYAIRLSAEILKTSSTPRSPRELLERLKASALSTRDSRPGENSETDPPHRPLLKQCLDRLEKSSPSAVELLEHLAVCADDGVEARDFLAWQGQGRTQGQVEHELAMARNLGLLLVDSSSSTVMGAPSREIRLRLHMDLLAILRERPLEHKEKSLQTHLYRTFVATSENLESKRSLQKQIFHLVGRYRNDFRRLVSIYDDFWIHLYLAGRLKWAYELGNSLLRLYGDDRLRLSEIMGNQAVILQDWGRYHEAMKLHKKEEEICLEYGDQAGLARSYGNQALILKDWGELGKAMALHEREERICRKLFDRAGLARSYGHQALILQDRGKLDDAMELLKRQEMICRELDDQAGLFRSYCNQALTLQAMGKHEAAIRLYEKVEAICRELEDYIGLSNCFWSIGLLLREQGQNQASMEKLEESIAIAKRAEHPDIEKRRTFLASLEA